MFDAFLLTRQWVDTAQGIRLEFWLKAEKGPIKVVTDGQRAIFFIKEIDIPVVTTLLNGLVGIQIKPLQLKTFESMPVAGVYFRSQQQLYRARRLLQNNDIACFESDIRPTDRFLAERFITGAVVIHDDFTSGTVVNPKLTPGAFTPELNVLSLDIETDYSGDDLYSIAFVSSNVRRVLMLAKSTGTQNQENAIEYIEYVVDELALLKRFIEWVHIVNPDVFIGWNVINFDFWYLQNKADKLRIPFSIGRNYTNPIWRREQNGQRNFVLVPGRVVLDGIDTLKTATYTFSNFSLEQVGQYILGRGKLIQDNQKSDLSSARNRDPLYKAKEIKRLFHQDKPTLAAYNLEDCQLVWDIFKQTELINFAIARSRLTGLEMDRVGGSVAAFENLYLPLLHRKGYIAPNSGDYTGQLSAPGGYVMDSKPGLYESVLVLDYKSLYPSIIRTFKVDPYGRLAALQETNDNIVPGFNGACFSKTENLLPGIIKQLWQARDQAKKEKNTALSQAIKIIMNSFYGVMGSPGCRLHDSRLTSSITKRSHEIIIQTVKLIESEAYTVIYGDTDSVFVALNLSLNNEQASTIGRKLVRRINKFWMEELNKKYHIESFLEMEYETHYTKFFMPTIRGSVKGSKKRYAGLVIDNLGHRTIIFKGLEAVRTDWTEFAQEFQKKLYDRIFGNESYADFIRNTIIELKSGELDRKLVYRKRLRQSLKEYIKNVPPHAQAAIKAEKVFADSGWPSRYKNTCWIEYVMTRNGPETIECQSSPLDYEHYIEKQLIPIAESIISATGGSIESILQNQYQLF